MRATRIVWRGAGAVEPHDFTGALIPRRSGLAPTCAMCGASDPHWTADDAFSDSFRPLSHIAQMFPHVVDGYPVSMCAACVWCSRSLRLRCAPFFAREGGVWFIKRRNLLAALLDPPEPPFVACAPLYGVAHGGEEHGWRALWTGEPALPAGVDVLSRLQAKHVMAYAAVAYSRAKYPLQWDDHTRVEVDVPLWSDLARRLGVIAASLRAGSVNITDTRKALATLRAGVGASMSTHRDWPSMTRGLDRYARSAWWPLLADLIPLPLAPPRPEKVTHKTVKPPVALALAPTPITPPPAAAPVAAHHQQLPLF